MCQGTYSACFSCSSYSSEAIAKIPSATYVGLGSVTVLEFSLLEVFTWDSFVSSVHVSVYRASTCARLVTPVYIHIFDYQYVLRYHIIFN